MSESSNVNNGPKSEIYEALTSIRLIDPHSHINPHSPASSTLADLLGYHYYTELAHSSGMPKSRIEDPSIGPKELVERLVGGLQPLENTAQYSWLIEICRTFFGFEEDRLHLNNWEALYDRSEQIMASAQWSETVLDQSNVQAVFLTNDFDDALEGFDTDTYIPCLRTDDLVFHLAKPEVRGRLATCTGIELDGSLESLRSSLKQRFEHFVSRGARACAISIPPSFAPTPVPDGRASTALNAVLQKGLAADASHRDALSRRVFWTLAELCDEFGLPFDLMIGVNRQVYPEGVFQGQDLYDSRVSLIQYRELFNSFPNVKFPISVLASVTNQELVSYAWIFPNVIANGHWWYSNTPSFISRDAAARLEAIPQTKQIGYYSDAYKLEFIWPKFDMYRQVLSGVLSDQFVGQRGWSVERAVELGRRVLRDNVEEIFPRPERAAAPLAGEAESDEAQSPSIPGALGVATAVAGVTEIVESFDTPETSVPETLDTDSPAAGPSSDDDLSLDIDALPGDEEVQELGVDDVELIDDSAPEGTSAEDLANLVEEDSLDVGNLLEDEEPAPEITQLRGESSFSPDDESLQLESDPTTGEFTLPVDGSDSNNDEEEFITINDASDLTADNVEELLEDSDESKAAEAEVEEFDLDFLDEDDEGKEAT
ncbi:glucuronate isomerase [Rhodopirellula sp. JC740]|uniref:Glucuronate isomerase n=1 Tax=Rhodopirellula halodulae TaxID=2894198 RepID=A0ABS8NDF0_9BACT|nr:glucuronate isomerase [Rhodopirellula sp. JC740]MCC9641581.1 glucuronate isomerase [Rhodopirellula sp. JC740]